MKTKFGSSTVQSIEVTDKGIFLEIGINRENIHDEWICEEVMKDIRKELKKIKELPDPIGMFHIGETNV